ncbi:D-alanyl-D-alanine carboxypeptidase [Agrococcus sp. Marseille-Q4369]|uniref:D-alanyl-D-alanine carboxypeptidase family protein n=1 Tax=Agrococcus sp. Marseille-Q4369 TaxID=2810513 RepID=UPI001B8AC6B6|nr:D-alanyl-D-alanine carboxypeptidase [Agrococcus sp. Marseille-Q4369]QUW19269.1 D-alanyl-D-alanine carboxypeptidase [Agrococcus sp. Marseille-Q4369]
MSSRAPATARRTHPLVVLLRSLLVIALVAAVALAAAVLVAPAPAIAGEPVEAPAAELPAAQVEWPESARAAGYGVVGIDGGADVWQAWGSEEAHPMASVAKLVTVLIVLDAHPIEGDSRGALITLDRDDVDAQARAVRENAPIAPVFDGMQVTQRDLIEWSLVDSAGNAIWSLASWAFGGMDGFAAAAAAWTDRHGLDDTVLADPAGLDARSVSSASDLTRMALMAVGDPVVLSTIQLESVRIPGIGVAPNTNRILGEHDIDGGKTGTLKVWGRNLFVTAIREVDGEARRVVGIVMGTIAADETDAAMIALLESVWPNFASRTIVEAGTVVAEYRAPWGATTRAVATGPLDAHVFADDAPDWSATVEPIEPGAVPQAVGEVSLERGDEAVPVRTASLLTPPDAWWRLTNAPLVLGWYFD